MSCVHADRPHFHWGDRLWWERMITIIIRIPTLYGVAPPANAMHSLAASVIVLAGSMLKLVESNQL